MCREQAAELRPHAEEFARSGGKLAVLGNGWPAMAKSWARHVGFPEGVEVLTDPSRKAYDLAGLKRSRVLTLLNPRSLARWVRALLRGFRQGRTAGDAWQQGGALVVLPSGEVSYRYVSLGPGDHPGPAALLEADPLFGAGLLHVRDGAVVRELEVAEADDVLGAGCQREGDGEEEGAHGGAL